MKTHYEAISEAFNELGGEREIREISTWVIRKYGDKWKDFSTPMADMVPVRLGGNKTSSVPDRYRVLERVARGRYRLAVNDDTKKAKGSKDNALEEGSGLFSKSHSNIS